MRKIGALILAVSLLFLAACEQEPSPTTPQVVTPSAPVPTESTEEVTPAPESPTPVIPDGEEKRIEVLLPETPLPETAYTPPEQPVRFYEDVTKTLIPSGEYGHIWPYLGGYYRVFDWANGEIYGICDEEGRIICDPVFHQVDVLEKDGVKLYAFYKYSRGEKGRESKITLARPDGTWAEVYDKIINTSGGTEFTHLQMKGEYGNYPMSISWRPSITLDYISVCKDGKWGAIDYYGNEIIPCVYNAPLRFSEGLASVISDDNTQITYIDSSENTVVGPFDAPPETDKGFIIDSSQSFYRNDNLVFYQGYAKFYKDGRFGIVDKSGNIVIEAKYDYISAYCDGLAVFAKDGLTGVIDLNENVLLEPSEKHITYDGEGVVIVHDGQNSRSINLFTGEQKPWSYNMYNKIFFNSNGGITLKLKTGDVQFDSRHFAYELSNGYFCLTTDGIIPTWRILNDSGETVAGPFDGFVDYDGAYGILYVRQRNEPYNNWTYELWMEVYDENGNRLLPGRYLSVKPFEGRYLVRTGTQAGLVTENGDWVIKVPLYDYMGD